MPLPEPVPRERIHTRRIECAAYRREDGLWDIEAHLTDTKTHDHARRDGGASRAAGEPIHEMRIRLTIDLDFVIHDCVAATEQSPYSHCGDVTPGMRALIGQRIGPGWRRRTLELLGGTRGCTHLVELLVPMATTAYQATGRARAEREQATTSDRRPYQIDACHVYRSDGPAVLQRWPRWYTGPSESA
ncbi:MAG: DUF2889 domain-containing protein [Pseudomonadota bacterium]|jgi:hypothetical protein